MKKITIEIDEAYSDLIANYYLETYRYEEKVFDETQAALVDNPVSKTEFVKDKILGDISAVVVANQKMKAEHEARAKIDESIDIINKTVQVTVEG